MAKKILVINGPNLNLLGDREKDIYGQTTLEDIENKMAKAAAQNKIELEFYQSNHEGEIVDFIHDRRKWADLIIINPGAFTHTSISIRDALLAVQLPVIELHLSNIFKREPFRQKSFISDIAVGIISGFGENSYYLALDAAVNI